MTPRSIPLRSFSLRPRSPIPPSTYICPTCRHASTKPTTNSKGQIVLEKPDKFRPPSHPSRRVTRPPRHYGPALTDDELAAMKTKHYPNTFPAEGTVMHKFLTNKALHVYISVGVLFAFAGWAFLLDFWSKNRYPELLPPGSMFVSHPWRFLAQYGRVYKMHVEAQSAEAAEARRRRNDEVRRRKEYLRHHGLQEETVLQKWGFGVEETPEEKRRREIDEELARKAVEGAGGVLPQRKGMIDGEGGEGSEDGYRDFDGERRKVKKWFGIW